MHTTICKRDNQQGSTVWHRELYSIFCNKVYGKKSGKEWIYAHRQLTHFAVHLKLTQHCKSTILQCKIKMKFK